MTKREVRICNDGWIVIFDEVFYSNYLWGIGSHHLIIYVNNHKDRRLVSTLVW